VAWEGEVWLFLKVGRWDFKKNSKELFFCWCGIGWLEKGGGFFFGFLFCFVSLLWYGDLMKIFSQDYIYIFWGMENFQHKN